MHAVIEKMVLILKRLRLLSCILLIIICQNYSFSCQLVAAAGQTDGDIIMDQVDDFNRRNLSQLIGFNEKLVNIEYTSVRIES